MDAIFLALVSDATVPWVVTVLVVGAATAFLVNRELTHRERLLPTRRRIAAHLRGLDLLLPLALGVGRDLGTALLNAVAPGRPLALFLDSEPPLRVFDRGEPPAYGIETASTVERHRARLAAGETVHDDGCGTILPLLSHNCRLIAVLVVGGPPASPLASADAYAGDPAFGALRLVLERVARSAALRAADGGPLPPQQQLDLPREVPGL